MNTTVRFHDHEEFHRSAMYMAGFGALAGLAAHWAGVTYSAWAFPVAATAALAGVISAGSIQTVRAIVIRASLLAAGTAGLVVLPNLGDSVGAVGSFCILFAAALVWGLRGRRLLLALFVGAVVALVARFALTSVITAQELQHAPAWMVSALAGTMFSFLSVLALLPRHVVIAQDPVGATFDGLRSTTGEVGELVRRGYGLWVDASENLPVDSVSRKTLEEGVLRLFEVAQRWGDVEASNNPSMAIALSDRMEILDKRIAEASDEVVRTQYGHARAALAEQLRYLRDIGTSRERVLARMHNYLAAMERLRLAVANLQSATASRVAVDVGPLQSTVEELGRDIDTYSDALAQTDVLSSQEHPGRGASVSFPANDETAQPLEPTREPTPADNDRVTPS